MSDIVVCVEVRETRRVETVLTRGIIRRDARSWSGITVPLCSVKERINLMFAFFFEVRFNFLVAHFLSQEKSTSIVYKIYRLKRSKSFLLEKKVEKGDGIHFQWKGKCMKGGGY